MHNIFISRESIFKWDVERVFKANFPYTNQRIQHYWRISAYIETLNMCRCSPGFNLFLKRKRKILIPDDHWYLRIILSTNYPARPIKNPLCIVNLNTKSNFKEYVIKSLSNKLQTIAKLDSIWIEFKNIPVSHCTADFWMISLSQNPRMSSVSLLLSTLQIWILVLLIPEPLQLLFFLP